MMPRMTVDPLHSEQAPTSEDAPTFQQAPAFEQVIASALNDLRSAFAELIEALPDRIRKAADLQRALKVDPKLGWQVYKVANAPDTLTAGTNVPKRVSMGRLYKAAADRGVPESVVRAVKHAFDEFEAVVEEHAGDRDLFVSMLSGSAGARSAAGAEQIDLQHRRGAFISNSHIWGVQAKAQLSCHLYGPAATDPDRVDAVAIRGLLGLRRFRHDAPWIVASVRAADDDGTVRRKVVSEPLDPLEEGSDRGGVLRAFCSQPIPRFRRIPGGSGFTNIELVSNGVGNTSAVTCFFGDIYREAFPKYRDEHNRRQRSQTGVRTPCGVLIRDVLVYDGTFGPITPKVRVYADHRDCDRAVERRKCDLLAQRESVTHLGRGLTVLHTPDVPRYPEMVQVACDRLGWNADRFDVYRCRVEYPVMPSSVVVQFDLPPRPPEAPEARPKESE